MEPQQARFTFAAFLALSAVIVFNALYLQSDGGFAGRAVFDSAALDGSRSFLSLDKQKNKGQDLEQAIQRELAQRNYFPGKNNHRVDGRMNVVLMGAIMAYQYDSGLLVTGLVSDRLLKSFLFGVDRATSQHNTAPRMSANTRQLVAEIQGVLSAKGHYDGKIDGLFKGRTMEAVRRFEGVQGLPVTGRISGLLVQELTRVTGIEFLPVQKQ